MLGLVGGKECPQGLKPGTFRLFNVGAEAPTPSPNLYQQFPKAN